MCTVVLRLRGGQPVRLLALRDELVGRAFDDPGRRWPDLPGVVGGRDLLAGGTWCATSVRSGVTALVLNRPEKRVADLGAPSRGVLPLLAVEYGAGWPGELLVEGMASFTLLLVGPGLRHRWDFDGTELVASGLDDGTTMVTSGGLEDGRAERHLADFAATDPADWQALVTKSEPADEAAALVVRHEVPQGTFATVFGQLITAEPGALTVVSSRTPWVVGSWSSQTWQGR